MKKLFLCATIFFAAAGIFAEKSSEPGKIFVELILDASNSMNEVIDGTPKMVTAKNVLSSLTKTMDPAIQLALRVYGDQFDPLGSKEKACQDSHLAIPFDANNRSQIDQTVQKLSAKGYTPIAYSFEKAFEDFSKILEGKKIIVLVSDGKESCGGDPCKVAQELKTRGLDVVMHVIGFSVDAQTRTQLECIAKSTGGLYFDAKNASELEESFKKVQEEVQSLVGQETKWAYQFEGKEIVPGTDCSKAPSLVVGKYTLKNLAQAPGEKLGEIKHCVLLSLKKGQIISIKSVITGIAGAKAKDDVSANLDIAVQFWGTKDQVLHSDFKEIYKISAYQPYAYGFSMDIPEDQDYCLSYSASGRYDYSPVGFNVGLEIQINDATDADSGKDAPSTFSEAFPLEIKRYPSNFLTANDVDRFMLNAPKGTLVVKVIPQEDKQIKVTIYNEDREQIWSSSSKNNGAIVRYENSFDQAQSLYLEIASVSEENVWIGGQKKPVSRAGKYEINITTVSAQVLPAA